jgi:hypothetical protein
MISVASGGTITTFSDRFTITGMTGTTDPAFITAATAAGNTVPATVDQIANDAGAGAAAGAANLMRYAPMQSVPPTKITKKDTKPLYPTSAYKIATAFLPTPSPTKTQTASQTFSADSMENTVRCTTKPIRRTYWFTDNVLGFARARPCW